MRKRQCADSGSRPTFLRQLNAPPTLFAGQNVAKLWVCSAVAVLLLLLLIVAADYTFISASEKVRTDRLFITVHVLSPNKCENFCGHDTCGAMASLQTLTIQVGDDVLLRSVSGPASLQNQSLMSGNCIFPTIVRLNFREFGNL